MESESGYEVYDQANHDKLQLLAAVFRIASFGEDEAPGSGDLVAYGRQGYAFGPAGDVVSVIKSGIQYNPDGLYEEGDRAHIASLQLRDDVYQFYAVLDQQALADYVYDTGALDQALVNLHYANYSRFPGDQPPVEEMIDALWPVSFKTQRLEVYKNLKTKGDLEIGAPHVEYRDGLLAALAMGDFERAQQLSQELFGADEVDIDELHELEITHTNEVDGREIQELAKLLSEQYFVAEKPAPAK